METEKFLENICYKYESVENIKSISGLLVSSMTLLTK